MVKKFKTSSLLLTVGGVFLWIFLSLRVYRENIYLSEKSGVWGSNRLLPQKHHVQTDQCTNVDVVFTWVNGTDPNQLALLGNYVKNPQSINTLYRDYGMLRFGIRSVEKFTPWIRNIYIFTNGQVPTWLNVSSDRYKIIFLYMILF